MKEVNIKGKIFTEKEIYDYGKKSIKRKIKPLWIIGIILVAVCIFMCYSYYHYASIGYIENSETGEPMTVDEVISFMPIFIMFFGVPGAVLLIIAFAKSRDPYSAGIDYLNKHFPYPVDNESYVGRRHTAGVETYHVTKPESGITVATKVFMIIGTVFVGTSIIGLAWCIPMCVYYFNRVKNGQPIGTGFKVCSLLFVSLIGGILMLCDSGQNNAYYVEKRPIEKVEIYYQPSSNNSGYSRPQTTYQQTNIYQQSNNEIKKSVEDITKSKPEKVISQFDKFEEMKKYKELLDVGIITQEEFEIEKKKLLG